MVNITTYLMNIAPQDQRKQAFTLVGALIALGTMLGNLTGGFLPGFIIQAGNGAVDQRTAYHAVMWLIVFGYLCVAGAVLKARRAQPVLEEGSIELHEKAPVGLLLFLGLMFVIQLFSEGSFMTFMNLYLSKELAISTGVIGSVYAAGNPLIILCSPLLFLFFKRLGAGRTLASGYAVICTCALPLAFFGLPVAAFAGTIFCMLATNFNGTARNLFGQESVAPRWRAIASAVNGVSWALGNALAALLGGRIIAGTGYQALFLTSAAAALTSILLYGVYERVRVPRRVTARGMQ
jgi:predicted MFS family arabinose efflux permease